MAKTINTKNPITSTPTIDNPKTLTVVVINEKNQPVQKADVSISPSNSSGVTNNLGEIQFTLGGAKKYEITATADGKTVTVPYYVTKDGATRLIVNPVYIKSIENKLNPSWFNLESITNISIGLGMIILLVFFWKLLHHKK